jgi:ABC-type oligopeptide transport system substrate-binding subunit
MKKKLLAAALIAGLALAFGMVLASCDDGHVDAEMQKKLIDDKTANELDEIIGKGGDNATTLSGTYSAGGGMATLTFTDKDYTVKVMGAEVEKGTYTIQGTTIHCTPEKGVPYTATISADKKTITVEDEDGPMEFIKD